MRSGKPRLRFRRGQLAHKNYTLYNYRHAVCHTGF